MILRNLWSKLKQQLSFGLIARYKIPSRDDLKKLYELDTKITDFFLKLNYKSQPISSLNFSLRLIMFQYRELLSYKALLQYHGGLLVEEIRKKQKTGPWKKHPLKNVPPIIGIGSWSEDESKSFDPEIKALNQKFIENKNPNLSNEALIYLSHIDDTKNKMTYQLAIFPIFIKICYDDLAALIRNTATTVGSYKTPLTGKKRKKAEESMNGLYNNWDAYWVNYKDKKYLNRLKKLVDSSYPKIREIREDIVHDHSPMKFMLSVDSHFLYTKAKENRFHEFREIENQLKMITTILHIIAIKHSLSKPS